MTRYRAIGNVPNEMIVTYYKQRSGAGLIITEGTSPSINGLGDLVAFGRPFINNPDLVERLKNNWSLSQDLKTDLFYTADERGYIDYPLYKADQLCNTYQHKEAQNINSIEHLNHF